MTLHSHYDPGHSDGDAVAAAGISAGMMIAVLGFIAAAVIVIAMLVWTPWNSGNNTTNTTVQGNVVSGHASGGGIDLDRATNAFILGNLVGLGVDGACQSICLHRCLVMNASVKHGC